METTTTYNFKVKIGDSEYKFNMTATTPSSAAKQLLNDLRECIKEIETQYPQ